MPAPDPEMIEYVTELRRREHNGERTPIRVGPYTAVVLAAVIRWVIDRERFAEHGEPMFQRLLDQLRLVFIEDLDHTSAVEAGRHGDEDELRRRESDGEQATLVIGPFSASLLVSAVIWAVRCGQLTDKVAGDAAEAVLKQMWPVVAADPRGRRYIERELSTGPA